MENNSTIVRTLNRVYPVTMEEKWAFARRRPIFFGYVAAAYFLSTQKQKPSRKEMDVLALAKQKEIQVKEHRIQYFHWKGEKETVLLIHGWNGHTGNFSRIVPALLEEGYNVIGIDLPGHGFSSGRYSNIVLSAKIVHKLVEEIGNPEVIITHSFGGAVATVAQELGVIANKLVYIAPPLRLEILRESFNTYYQLTEKESESMRDVLERKVKQPLSSLDLEKAGPKFDNSLLVIHDEDDLEIPFTMGLAVSRAWKNSKLVKTKGLGHKMILRTESVKDEIISFLKGINI
ncbi:alpha/beta hydrolase [Leptospira sp. 2 VSF19]|uniref:Alpha/beta hydrolase n=1 Tax=Leptospira soteropolitanensis TaxID=2950025 RepID=A0AAW5VC79_9LEPT|nr:alpha/beta hydrolase [Leptospira soteropolitanensis]MCW7491666.1 alpha/beta hydrolase [Leptospira soteropolitanensis]MCW7499250.1 alpha/beta hydrolase [Leptospira soteropolitanensis]MCW7521158.1 alpha/beta hydrolase [Leptospira soteropolitanensis]MCW7525354.1 alpha/beta hydrolase [Leptospira soteropolitanensis]MCW7529221.1 alpha/beta hydrolase [Leptospira soteropolitanensis]